MRDPLGAAARRLGWTPGQAWTVVPGLVLAVPVLLASVLGVAGRTAPGASAAPVQSPLPLPLPLPSPQPVAAPSAPLPDGVVPALPVGPAAPVPVLPPPPGLLPGLVPLAPEPSPAQPSAAPRPSAAASPRPLAVAAAGWTSTVGDDATVPATDLPVQAGPAGEVARSWVRLSGQGEVLLLPADNAPGAGFGGPVAGARACQTSTTAWTPGRAQAQAPPFDAQRCVTGTLAGGTWSFDLSSFPDVTGAGITLLPEPASPLPFRIAFRTSLENL